MTTQTVWDPIEGRVNAASPEAAPLTAHPFAKLVRQLTGPMLLLSLIGFGIAVFSESWRFYGIAAAVIGFVFVLFGDDVTGLNRNRQARIANAARAGGYLGGTALAKDKIAKLAGRIRSLMVLRAFGSIPLVLEHELWGRTKAGIPVWMGLSVVGSQAFLGGPKANVRANPKSSHGELAMFIVAYRLDRDTGLYAEIMPEFATAKGPLDLDVKTESVEFNAKFNIRLRSENGRDVSRGVSSAALLQVLTPATQATLLDLSDVYAARVIVDHDTVFFGGYRNFQTTDAQLLQTLLTKAIEDFAEAATAFKRYAE